MDNSWHFCFFKKLFGEIAVCQNGSSRFTFFCDTVKFLGDVYKRQATLQAFVRQYRDPQYTLNASTKEGVVNAILEQRRVEFYGEGHDTGEQTDVYKRQL